MSATAMTTGALPQLKEDFRIAPFEDGTHDTKQYLVEVGDSCFVVNQALRDVLAALRDGPATLEELARIYERRTQQPITVEVLSKLLSTGLPDALFSHTPYPIKKRPFVFSFRLFPEWMVRPVSSRLSWLFARRVVIPALCALLVAEYFVFSKSLSAIHHTFEVTDLPLLYLVIIGSTLFHELGHAAACRRYGCPHGEIGFALYFIFPAFYTDVTKAWRLSPRRRAVVDIGGVYFQCLLIIGFALYASLSDSAFALRVVWLTHFALFFTLNPVFKMDGYWLLSDLSGLTNLHQQVRQTLSRGFARLRGKSIDTSRQVSGLRLKVLYIYIALAAVYTVYVVHFLYYSIQDVVRYYPQQARWFIGFIVAAQQHGDSGAVLRGLLWLAYVSAWPFLLAVITFYMLRRVVRAVVPKEPFEISLTGWRRAFFARHEARTPSEPL
ncbi:MAG TPA: hypothetical protein VGV59_18285 [Pyrinomonadaceae bacterium]|nr:hypothetical protein [Pyrinomonadaceae bacterium]